MCWFSKSFAALAYIAHVCSLLAIHTSCCLYVAIKRDNVPSLTSVLHSLKVFNSIPLSDGPLTRCRRITKSGFCPCSTCRSDLRVVQSSSLLPLHSSSSLREPLHPSVDFQENTAPGRTAHAPAVIRPKSRIVNTILTENMACLLFPLILASSEWDLTKSSTFSGENPLLPPT